MASLTCVQDTGVRFNNRGDKINTTSQARTEQLLYHLQNALEDTRDTSNTPRYTPTQTMDSLPIIEPTSPSSPRKTKLRRALALEDMMADISLCDHEDQIRNIKDTEYQHFSWEFLDICDISRESTDVKITQKPRVRAATLTASASAAKKLDLEEKISAALDGLDSRAFVRPPQAEFLLKKTLRGA
ncbi:hypothetical protein HBH56_175430 [Parastagonospora nodorum]|uniref:Uncharacterized protein n=2 Tax=Phaeosphaeria nodorum (strain SN15 / ATCC MYA-4574 / FGSC 10173) TaxID=321614 RepID=A0A7U2F0B2_PHANO|nr:hypothetical protein SNOG_01216 [Parastagonospora nodorum SN15]KAH3908469.1 hypothetical protein HBH56_175430 [Parastagonospora nodorum]EAT90865.1 hypothetical protein SNOG_01216 [Parastagonospora nodorum SN15]KAH3926433.1 hypothetical protein HBH54_167730 [Parastagonospora nodorum]KAH3971269.1 hypothetical protein HBH51_110100 [Parastagonospora nodorum]KAH4007545.1 hypothetical protein HBI10_009450 [Parastagonospora nodorum]